MSKEFRFMPEHTGKQVRHRDGQKGIVVSVNFKKPEAFQLMVKWSNGETMGYYLDGRWSIALPVCVFFDESPSATVVDQLNDIHYLPGGAANFRLKVTDGTTEHVAAVDLFGFLMWAQADGIIDSYSAENVGEEVVILPVPDDEQSHRATAQVKRLYVWLQQMPLATFTRALNERPAMWTVFDENMEII